MSERANLKVLLIVFTFLLVLVPIASGRTIYIDDDGPADFNNIQAAIDDSHNGDTVKIMPGIYTGNGNRGIDFKGKAITVQSTEPDDPCVIASTVLDCQGLNRGFYFHSQENSDSVINGLTIINGYAADGGGIINDFSSPTIKNCIFKGNSVDSFSGHGGGMYNYICNPIIMNCTFSNNYAHYGAGMYNGPKSHPILQNCLLIENEGVAGGGMYNVDGSNPTITNCSFINNTGCNDRDDCVGGIRNQGGSSYGGCNPVITNCILWGNSDGGGTDESAQISYYAGGTPIINYCCIQSWSGSLGGTGNFGDDPLFSYSGYHLDANSPCIDVGDPNGDYNGQVDIDGQPRIMDSRVDIGCDEYTNKPIIKIWPKAFELLTSEESPVPQTKILSVRNVGLGVINWQITEDCDWLEVLPTNGDSVGEIDQVTITVDATGLPRDDYNCELQISDPNAINSPQVATIRLRVGPRLVPQEYPTIQAAIDAAKNGDTIIVNPDIYMENINISHKNITVISIDPNDPCVVAGTVIQGDGTTSVVTFFGHEDASCTLAGFTITGGSVEMGGAGIIGNHTLATITNCFITNNASVYGGAVAYCDGTIRHCTIWENTGGCGGVCNCDGTISNCLVAYNGYGSMYGNGCGICGCDGTIIGCTIASNENYGVNNCNGAITNCIVWDNPGQILDSSQPTYSCWPDGTSGTGNINADPLFINPADGDYHLMVNSPCVNAGDPFSTLGPGETDIDGEPRIINRFIDMGSDEVNYEGPLLKISPVGFEFFVYPDGLNPHPQTMSISNMGSGTLNWEITEDCNWLQVLPSAGASTGELDEVALRVDISTLAPQDYNCQVTVFDPNAVNSPQSARVYLYFLKEYHVPSPNYPTIQSAIDAASYRDIVVVEPNTYYENINLNGKNITVTSINPNEQYIIDTTIIDANRNGRPVTFKGTEKGNCELTGFTIMGGYISGAGGGILGNNTQAQITKCHIIINDASDGGGVAFCDGEISHCWIRFNQAGDDGGGVHRCNARISNCLITDNHAGDDGGGLYECDGDIINCTIAMNGVFEGYGAGLDRCDGNIRNCIFTGNFGGDMHFSSTPTYSCWIGATGTGNINADPRVNFHDYHLQSEAGRWEMRIGKGWVRDDVTSPCIDAGNPNSDWTGELWPHGQRINMGAYGGTPEASMSLSDVGNIADLNNDDSVNYMDLILFTDKWPYHEILLPEDFDRNGFVDFADFAIISNNWRWEK